MKGKKIGLVSLGCPKNLVDSEEMVGQLTQAGYTFTPNEEEADLVLINTCGFIEAAKEESIDAILAFYERRIRGDLKGLVVTGCLAQRYAKELAEEIPEVDRFLSIEEETRVVEIVDHLLLGEANPDSQKPDLPSQRSLLTPSHTAYVKISDGCSNRCSYCTIPLIRGPHKSREIPELVDEAGKLSERGVREIILIGQDIARFGSDRGAQGELTRLLHELCRVQGLSWVRLMYVHPDHIEEELIDLMASEQKIVPYLDLPVQHIHDQILKSMNRKRDARSIRKIIGKLRKSIPELVLRTTVIVGFPGETQEAFQELYDFVEETRFDHLGAFSYSREEGTPAASLPDQVTDEIKEKRREEILHLQAGISLGKNQDRVDTIQKVLVEGSSPETNLLLAGRYYGQAPEIDGQVLINKGNAVAGEFFDVRITAAHTYDLIGEIVEEKP